MQKLLTWPVVVLVFAFFVTGGVPVHAPLPPDALAPEVKTSQPNRRPLSVQGASSAIGNAVLEGSSFHAPEHFQGSAPFLFLTAADVARAREGVRTNPEFARQARELARQAEGEQLVNLPALDNSWWHALTNKPWRDCYPENHHYTLAVPQRWASLARDCARASLVNEAPALADKGRQVLLQLSDYSFAWEHFDTGMFYTIWAAQALEAYDILRAGFSAPERARMDAFFERYLAAVVKSDDYWVEHEPGGKLNNHYAWHKLGRCDGPAEVVQCGFPAHDSPHPKPLPMRLVQCRRTGAWFLAVYCLGSERAEPLAVEAGKPRTWEIMLNASGKTARHSVPSL